MVALSRRMKRAALLLPDAPRSIAPGIETQPSAGAAEHGPPAVVGRLGELVEMGFGQIVLFTHDRCSDETLELLAAEVIPRL